MLRRLSDVTLDSIDKIILNIKGEKEKKRKLREQDKENFTDEDDNNDNKVLVINNENY